MTCSRRFPPGFVVVLLCAGACRQVDAPDLVEACATSPSASYATLPALIQYQRARLGSLCELAPTTGAWRIGVSLGGYSGEEIIYTRLRLGQRGVNVQWRRLELGEAVDSGDVLLSSALDRAVWRAIHRKEFGPQVDSGYVCTHCGSIRAEVRADSAVHWYLGNFTDPPRSGLHRALIALDSARGVHVPQDPSGASERRLVTDGRHVQRRGGSATP